MHTKFHKNLSYYSKRGTHPHTDNIVISQTHIFLSFHERKHDDDGGGGGGCGGDDDYDNICIASLYMYGSQMTNEIQITTAVSVFVQQ